MKQQVHVFCRTICFVILFSIILSAALVFTCSDHVCIGDSCEICSCIHSCQQMLKQLSMGTAALLAMHVFVSACIRALMLPDSIRSLRTLIHMKVKLSC